MASSGLRFDKSRTKGECDFAFAETLGLAVRSNKVEGKSSSEAPKPSIWLPVREVSNGSNGKPQDLLSDGAFTTYHSTSAASSSSNSPNA